MQGKTARARKLRERQTKAESLLWMALRAGQLCGLKFRRQHAIGPYFADFACIGEYLIVELDGGYHDYQHDKDMSRQRYLESSGWTVIRFPSEDIIEDVNAVTVAITEKLERPHEFRSRTGGQSGMFGNAAPGSLSPGPDSPTSPASGRGGRTADTEKSQ